MRLGDDQGVDQVSLFGSPLSAMGQSRRLLKFESIPHSTLSQLLQRFYLQWSSFRYAACYYNKRIEEMRQHLAMQFAIECSLTDRVLRSATN